MCPQFHKLYILKKKKKASIFIFWSWNTSFSEEKGYLCQAKWVVSPVGVAVDLRKVKQCLLLSLKTKTEEKQQ